MKFRSRNRMHSEVNTHSFNDIMFFLMLFFLIASTLAHPSAIKLLLPKAGGEQVVQRNPIEVSVSADTTYYIGKTPVDLALLEQALIDSAAGMEDPVVRLQIDRNLTMQVAAEVMDIGARNKIKMILALQNK